MANKEGAQPPRIYVDSALNSKVDVAHVTLMAEYGSRISKTDFVNALLRIGLAHKEELYAAFNAPEPESVIR